MELFIFFLILADLGFLVVGLIKPKIIALNRLKNSLIAIVLFAILATVSLAVTDENERAFKLAELAFNQKEYSEAREHLQNVETESEYAAQAQQLMVKIDSLEKQAALEAEKNKLTPEQKALQDRLRKVWANVNYEKSKVGYLLVENVEVGQGERVNFYDLPVYESRQLFKVVCKYFRSFPESNQVEVKYQTTEGAFKVINVNYDKLKALVGDLRSMDKDAYGELLYDDEKASKAFDSVYERE